MDQQGIPVFDAIRAAPYSRLLASLDLGDAGRVAIWRNSDSEVRYAETPYHTLTLYLDAATEVRRLDRPQRLQDGGPLCLLPQGAPSGWRVGQPFSLLHFYMPDASLRGHLAAELDRDPAGLTLPEITFGTDPRLRAMLARLAGLAAHGGQGDLLQAQTIAADLRHHLLTAVMPARPRGDLRGGLGPRRARIIRALVEDCLGERLDLARLAAAAGLSQWHFQRAFCETFGQSPHDYLTARRLAHAEAMLRRGEPPAGVAAACGFSSQSHLTRAFRKARGVTPGRFARLTRPMP